ncbi:hypothetical protein [Streptomyces sp. WAC06614]|uniref:hypothetical protein n=1 Tax=Streptomyces sp. WAC06614 TaxID=2487416 RepID=UPI000F789E65|nr:hypothetical protein [Streptomyces sp. WAC06614]RSS82404.1 hypothetical protein EF918_07245 [Streptomyces sp. WAC06614]
MTFDAEWAHIRAEQASVRLNQLDGGGGGGADQPDLKSSPEAKKAAADALQQVLEPDTRTAGDHADTATTAARTAFSGWQTASALQTVEETWAGQVKMLLGRLAGEQTALRGSGLSFGAQELRTRDAYRALIGEQGRH